jgi:hypothetical protein
LPSAPARFIAKAVIEEFYALLPVSQPSCRAGARAIDEASFCRLAVEMLFPGFGVNLRDVHRAVTMLGRRIERVEL